jgi:PAS domain S-box-containing protein
VNNLGILLADQNARLFQAVDLVLQEARVMVLAAGVRTPDEFRNLMQPEEVHEYLVSRLGRLPQADALSLIDDTGKVVSFSRAWPAPNINTANREFYRQLREHNDPGPFVGSPFQNSTNGAWDIPVERRISGPQGEFLGIVVVMVETQYFEDLYKTLATSNGESVAVFRRDGTMLARHPHLEKTMGEKLPTSSAWYGFVASGGGTFRSLGALDGIARIISVHPLRDFPLVVTVTTSEEVELSDWRRQSLFIVIGTLCSVIGLAFFLRALGVQFRRLERSQATLAAQNAELQAGRVRLERQTSELKQTADALRESEGRFRDFALTSSDWFWETDKQHCFTYLSENIRTFEGNPDSYVGTTRMENASDVESEPAKWRAHLAVLGRRESFRDFVYTRKGDTGDVHTASVSGTPLFDPSGRFLGYRGTARDVTDEIIAEHSLRAVKVAAETSNLAKSEFLANMSHELRTPLNAIIGFSEMLQLNIAGPLRLKQKEYVGIIHDSGQHLLNVINEVLDLARIDAGKFELNEERGADPRHIVSTCLALVKDSASTRMLELAADLEEPIPLLLVDPTRITQILLNLLSNAVKFTDPGGSVTVGVRRTVDGGVKFEVRDTGPGMTAAELVIALEPFGQINGGYSRQHEGTGLGLPLARRLAELHDGALRILSDKVRGTTVILVLPATRVVPDNAAPVVEAHLLSAAVED